MKTFFVISLFISGFVFAKETETKIKGLHKSQIAYSLIDIETGKILKTHQGLRNMPIASVSKILTYFFALKVLGPEYQFQTSLAYTGEIKNGVLDGDVYLIGSGDPLLQSPHLLNLVHSLKSSGIKKVIGQFYVDGKSLQAAQSISTLGLSDQADNPASSGLNIDFNRFDVWSEDNLLYPPLESIKMKKQAKYAWGQRFQFAKFEKHREHWIQHTKEYIPPVASVPTKNATLFTGNYFRYLCEKFSIFLPAPKERKKITPKLKELALNKSLPLLRIAELGLEYSNNLVAEIVLQTAAKELNGMPQNSKISAETMLAWYEKQFPKIDWKKLQMINGSGLTVHNQASPLIFAKILSKLYHQKVGQRSFFSLLSVNGKSGGIRRRFKHPNLAFSVFAKTGSLFYVNNLAGYLITRSGKILSFAFFTTDHENRTILSGKNPKQKRYLRRKSMAWGDLSNEAMDSKIEDWVHNL